MLRTLAVDRQEPPGALLSRFDTVLSQLGLDQSATCIYAQLHQHDAGWQLALGTAGHLPPLLITDSDARYLQLPTDPLLGTGRSQPRATTHLMLPPGGTLLLFTDGLVERREQDLTDGLDRLRGTATKLSTAPPDELCDELLRRLAPRPTDDVCLLAAHIPPAPRPTPAPPASRS